MEALEDNFDGNISEPLKSFDLNRPAIKSIAKNLISQNRFESDGSVLIKSQDIERFIVCDETVLDTGTGLMWAAGDNDGDISWHDAKEYCDTYWKGGYTDWRMPTQDEVYGLYEAGIRPGPSVINITSLFIWISETTIISFGVGTRCFHNSPGLSKFNRALPVRGRMDFHSD